MTSFLTWFEARPLAVLGNAIRREAWTYWLRRITGGIWQILDEDLNALRVVSGSDFSSEDFFAEDWTTDPLGTVRDVCARRGGERRFVPPGIGLTGNPSSASVDLVATIGAGVPDGTWQILFFLDGAFVGELEATEPGKYTLPVACDPTAIARAWIDVTSRLPLPFWKSHAEWRLVFGDGSYDTINLAADFPGGGFLDPPGWPYGAGVTYGPYSGNRWIYSHADDPASADDDLAINGVKLFPDDIANTINGGATTFLHFLPAGSTMAVNVWNAGGGYGAGGSLRLYNRPLP